MVHKFLNLVHLLLLFQNQILEFATATSLGAAKLPYKISSNPKSQPDFEQLYKIDKRSALAFLYRGRIKASSWIQASKIVASRSGQDQNNYEDSCTSGNNRCTFLESNFEVESLYLSSGHEKSLTAKKLEQEKRRQWLMLMNLCLYNLQYNQKGAQCSATGTSKCVNSYYQSTCLCKEGFSGTRCEIDDEAEKNIQQKKTDSKSPLKNDVVKGDSLVLSEKKIIDLKDLNPNMLATKSNEKVKLADLSTEGEDYTTFSNKIQKLLASSSTENQKDDLNTVKQEISSLSDSSHEQSAPIPTQAVVHEIGLSLAVTTESVDDFLNLDEEGKRKNLEKVVVEKIPIEKIKPEPTTPLTTMINTCDTLTDFNPSYCNDYLSVYHETCLFDFYCFDIKISRSRAKNHCARTCCNRKVNWLKKNKDKAEVQHCLEKDWEGKEVAYVFGTEEQCQRYCQRHNKKYCKAACTVVEEGYLK